MPPTEAAIAIRAVTVADLVFEDADCTCGTAVSDGVADTDWVLVIVDATTLAVGATGTGSKFEPGDVGEIDAEVDETLVGAEEDAEEDLVEEVLWEEVVPDVETEEEVGTETTGVDAKDEVV